MTVPYENELSGIIGVDDSIEPEVLIDAKHLVLNMKRTLSDLGDEAKENISDKETNAKKKKIFNKSRSVEDTLKEIHEKKEEGRERRHREKLELFKQFCEKYQKKTSKE
ncbi:uncharacterized protein LOC113004030 [Solenopsis invicta]|uniref:uncharacterized protein LOC113004030 n=1 Tax=Solenopsis invicta TaxID=13686 RepID=UPI00193D9711|nr:uncharacterized protein LOC113004030 [Solenopsis invicta]